MASPAGPPPTHPPPHPTPPPSGVVAVPLVLHRDAQRRRRSSLSRELPPDDADYEAAAEAEAAAAAMDPVPPCAFPLMYEEHARAHQQAHQAATATPASFTPSSSSALPAASSAAAGAPPGGGPPSSGRRRRRLDHLEERLGPAKMSQFVAIQQNPTRENPAVTEEIHKSVHKVNEMIAGSAASVITRMCVAPFDVLKIRFQIQEQSAGATRQYTSVWQACKSIARREGITAFWKGNASAELMVIPYGAVSFLAFSTCKSWFTVVDNPHSPYASYQHVAHCVAGSFAGFCATVSTYPLDLLRTRFAAQQQERVYRGIVHAAQHIWHHEGIGGFYVGLVPTLIGIVPLMALQFGCYEGFKQAFKNFQAPKGVNPNHTELTFMQQTFSGFSAGVISKFLTMPLDVIKRRFQVSGFDVPAEKLAASATSASASAMPAAPSSSSSSSLSSIASSSSSAAPSSHPATVSSFHAQSPALTHHPPGSTPALNHLPSTTLYNNAANTIMPPHVPSLQVPILKAPLATAAAGPASGVLPNLNAVAAASLGGAGVDAGSSAKPVRVGRRRPLSQPVAGRRPFTGVWDCARGIVQHEGLRGLFKGSVPSLLKAGPQSAIIYMVYEQTIRWLNRDFNPAPAAPC